MIFLDGESLTIESVYDVALCKEEVEILEEAKIRMKEFRRMFEDRLNEGEEIYGVNTGFGELARKKIDAKDMRRLQLNLVRSHATGFGSPMRKDVVRAAMLIKVNSLLSGNSCVRPEVAMMLKEMLNKDVVPFIPAVGSLGASGDLSPSAYLALCMIGEGTAYHEDRLEPSARILSEAEIKELTLEPKEGLSLLNGTCFSTAMASIALKEAKNILDWANSCVALNAELFKACRQSFDERLMKLRRNEPQGRVAEEIRKKLKGSSRLRDEPVPQDNYSIRCAPQVHGAVLQAIGFANNIIQNELNAVTDNPVMVDEGYILHGGNFHAQNSAMVSDILSLVLSYLSELSLARIHRMMLKSSGVKDYFAANPGLESGLMITEYVAAALNNDNSHLIHPSSSYPASVSGGVEDHASHGVNAGLKALQVCQNVSAVISIELIVASNAVNALKADGLSEHSRKILSFIRSVSPLLSQDRSTGEEVQKLSEMVRSLSVEEALALVHL